jgi:hypothetical protein
LRVFDQVAVSLNVQDMVELILVRDFAIPSWELDRPPAIAPWHSIASSKTR